MEVFCDQVFQFQDQTNQAAKSINPWTEFSQPESSASALINQRPQLMTPPYPPVHNQTVSNHILFLILLFLGNGLKAKQLEYLIIMPLPLPLFDIKLSPIYYFTVTSITITTCMLLQLFSISSRFEKYNYFKFKIMPHPLTMSINEIPN